MKRLARRSTRFHGCPSNPSLIQVFVCFTLVLGLKASALQAELAVTMRTVNISIPDTLVGVPGDTIAVPVILTTGGENIAALGAAIKATNGVLSFLSFSQGPIVPGPVFNLNAPSPDSVKLAFTDFGGGPIMQDGLLVTIALLVDSTIENDTVSELDFSELSATDPSFNPLPIDGVNGKVTVKVEAAVFRGRKFEDLNANGAPEPEESGLAGWEIVLSGASSDTAITDDSGFYQFSNLRAGDYTVGEEQQPGWQQTFPPAPGTHNLTLAAGDTVENLDFGNWIPPGSIHGMKWNDLNGDGVKQANEPGIPGWRIELVGAAADSAITDSFGNYRFMNLAPGDYTVSEVLMPGWQQTFPPAPGTYSLTLAAGDTVENLDFGNWIPPGSIHGMKWNDLDGDGVRQANEPGIPGWQIELSGPAADSAITDSLGNYWFMNLAPGDYTVSEVLMPGWQQTFPPAPGTHSLTLAAGDTVENLDFGNWIPPGSIHGMKWNDLDSDGVKQTNELGIPGWRIELNGAMTDSAITDSLGNYWFMNLIPGNYTVSEVLTPGWQQTFPPAPGTHDLTLAAGDTVENIDFGNWMPPGSIHGMKWNDADSNGVMDANEQGLVNWLICLNGTKKDSTLTDSTGRYRFTNLPPGDYVVSEEMVPGWRQAFPASGSYDVALISGTVIDTLDFGNYDLRVGVEKGDDSGTPTTFELLQNFPNPFNPATTIKYAVPYATRVTIEIYDVRGSLVAILKDEVYQAGYHQVKFDASSYSGGVYFCRLKASGYVEARKMLLLR